ncbi:MAG: DUF1844 domain-containing protein [Candidatus Methylomirabilales bacterium]
MPEKGPGEDEEPSFRVTDRRRVGPEGSQEPAQAPESESERTAEAPPTEKEEQERKEKEFVLLPIPDLVRIFIAELQTRALVHMGLIPNPATRLVAKDLLQARLAIDCTAALIEQLSPLAAPAEREELQHMLADLRLNFVRQSGGSHGAV